MKLSSRLDNIFESSTFKMNMLAKELAQKGFKVVNFTAGEPDFPVLPKVKAAAIKAIEEDFSKYTPVAGIPELKKAISEKLKKENDLVYAPDQILVSVGAKHSLYNFFMAVISPGDEVIIPSPYWVSYPEMVKLAGGVPVILPTTEANEFKISAKQLKSAITTKTKAFIFNSPSNPTGSVYSLNEMKELAAVLKGTSILVASDEIYEKLIYDETFHPFASLLYDQTVTINGFSKAFAMTGWRLGYAAGPKDVIAGMTLIQSQSTSNPTSLVQKAGVEALATHPSELKGMVDAFERRRDIMLDILGRCKFCSPNRPKGAFYLFLNIERLIGRKYNKEGKVTILQNGDDVAFYLLETVQVVTVPGSGFGAPSYIRLSFAVSDEDVKEGCQRIVRAFEKLD